MTRPNKVHNSARWISAILLFGIFIDYGGGFDIKTIAGLLALSWVLLQKSSFHILRRRRADLIVFIVIPGLLGLLHLCLAVLNPFNRVSLMTYGVRFYNTISSPLVLILMFPLFYYAGSHAVMRQIVVGFRIVVVIILVVFALHITGAINLRDYWGIAQGYRIGYIGLDPHLQEVEDRLRPNLAPRIAHVIPLALGYEFLISLTSTSLMFLSLLVVGSRGLLIGAFILMIFWMFIVSRISRLRIIFTRIIPLGVIVISVMLLLGVLGKRFTGSFAERMIQAFERSDLSTQIRIGHMEGYLQLLRDKPWTFLVGMGPIGEFTNPFLGVQLSIVEMSVLNLALWYGFPYAVLYSWWLYRAAWRLWNLRGTYGFEKTDISLILGATIFWLTGNFNPQMTSPFAIIAYMLLVARIMELRVAQHSRYK